MPKVDHDTYNHRTERVFLTLSRYPLGLTEAELEQITGIQRRTLNNYLRALETEGKIYKEGTLWIALPYDQVQLRKFDLSPEEAMTLYLAARLLTKQQDKRNEPAETALAKLAAVLTADAGVGNEIHQAALELARRPDNTNYSRVFRTVMQAYIYRRVLRITYEPLDSPAFETDFSPYLLEPSAIGFTTYVIGHSSIVDEWRTYKLERIREAALTRQEYTIPATFPGLDILRTAWSIIHGNKLVKVALRFSPAVRQRVLETRWHPSQDWQDDPDKPGYLLWTAQVADITDMLPWVKGWGADVEAVEPKELRDALILEAKRLAAQYQVSNLTQPPAYRLLWAKADKKSDAYHLLLYHLIDVGQVALALWQSGLNNNLRQRIADWLGLSVDDAGRLMAFWASLHDLGKASPAFQDHPNMPKKLKDRVRRELPAAGLALPARSGGETRARHEIISTRALQELLAEHSTLPAALAELIAQGLGGHHGAWPLSTALSRVSSVDTGQDEWLAARQSLVHELASIFQPPPVAAFQPDTFRDNIMLTFISAIVSVADWLGSDEDNFPYESEVLPSDSYARHSLQHARYALLRAEWQAAPPMPPLDFEKAFGFLPSQAQQQVKDTLTSVALPALAIIEAPMGSGKTEAALAVYAQWAQATDSAGLYVAMPTTATSNQMHGRVAAFLSAQFGQEIEPLLVHSQALLRDAPAESDAVEEQDDQGYRAGAQAWFLPRKKSLLAPFGVGTVDQALMSILQTKHFFVRLLGLSHKVVIFDEVHAYDAYMSELFERLLAWLRQINASVIVLSATLPHRTRQRLLQAYTGSAALPPDKEYPRLTFAASDGKSDAIELDKPRPKTLEFEWVDGDEESIIRRLADELRAGGCAVVICNTIRRAQQLYEALSNREEKLCDDDNLILFHARFPVAWRDEIERDVLKKFGPGKDKTKPNPDRPPKAIVIATQVVEQSLDLDFDVMISDHAPLDLLLQRAGRFQRHAVNDPRPQHPFRLLIAKPEFDGRGIPRFSKKDVYEEYVLLRSWIALERLDPKRITLPTDLPALIEQVYGEIEITNRPDLREALAKAKEKMKKKQVEAEDLAEERMVREPSFRRLLYQTNMQLEEDDARVHKAFRALTRDGDPGLQVVCLHRVGDKLYLEPGNLKTVYNPAEKSDTVMIRELARHIVNVRHSDPAVEQSLLADSPDPQVKSILARWKKIAALRYCRVAIFEAGVCPLYGTNHVMILKKENKLGLQIKEV